MDLTGKKAPELGVGDQDGVVRHLADYRGKVLVLFFYPKASTPG